LYAEVTNYSLQCVILALSYIQVNLISILGYLFRVIRWHNKMEESSMMTWMSSNVNIVADIATRAKYIIALEAARELGVVPSVLVLCSSIV
jgi:hypothetical protein